MLFNSLIRVCSERFIIIYLWVRHRFETVNFNKRHLLGTERNNAFLDEYTYVYTYVSKNANRKKQLGFPSAKGNFVKIDLTLKKSTNRL